MTQQLSIEQLYTDMKETYQVRGQNIHQHGISVYKYFNKIIDMLYSVQYSGDVKIPDIYYHYRDFLTKNLPNADILKEYMELHDCGKPYCRIVGEDGRQHFPNHAEVSYEIYTSLFNNKLVAELILGDMDIHILKDVDVQSYINRPVTIIVTQLLVGLAELLANAQMFGGVESTSFKIKYNNLERRAKRILLLLNKEQ